MPDWRAWLFMVQIKLSVCLASSPVSGERITPYPLPRRHQPHGKGFFFSDLIARAQGHAFIPSFILSHTFLGHTDQGLGVRPLFG